MKILILSKSPRLFSTKRLLKAARDLGHSAVAVNPMACSLLIQKGEPTIFVREGQFVKGGELDDTDFIIPRIGNSCSRYGLAVLKSLENLGIPSVNPSQAIGNAQNKLLTLQILSRHFIDIPPTLFAGYPEEIMEKLDWLGSFPIVIKPLMGTHGTGVMLINDEAGLESLLEGIRELSEDIMLQKFVSESQGRDIRVLVVGDRVVAAMRREARDGEFRSNLYRGGTGTPVELDPRYTRTAIEATRLLGLRVAGVDLLEGKNGPVVMEVNASPGLEGIESVTGVPVAEEIIEYSVRFAAAGRRGKGERQSAAGILPVLTT
jgi:ribosomal protein S6--L-glutamate ligase